MQGANSPAGEPPTAGTGSADTDPYSAGYDLLVVNGVIDDTLFVDVMQCVTNDQVHDRAIVALVTLGGSANPGYRIARYLQTIYEEIVAFVPSVCKSAGTLVLAGAHKLLLTPFGEIGPLDVQLLQRDEIIGRRSGLNTRSALSDLKEHAFELFEHFAVKIVERSGGAVSFRLASEISATITSGLMAKVYEQVNPESLGQDARDLKVAMDYCNRLNARSQNLKADAVTRLVHNYPSHDFVIDLEEAREIFERVEAPTASLIRRIRPHLSDLMTPRPERDNFVRMLSSEQPARQAPRQPSGSGTAQNSPDRPTTSVGSANGPA